MFFVHENNIKEKIKKNYHGLKDILEEYYSSTYLPVKEALMDIDFSVGDEEPFKRATEIINNYYVILDKFAKENKITSQSKFRSSFLEEISTYLFSDNHYIRDGILGIYNKKVYAGMKIGSDLKVSFMDKDVDFCIGKKVKITVQDDEYEIILPVIAVEVKTYLDATMFGEVQFSSKLIKSAIPNVKTFVLMETYQVEDDKITAARYDNILNEMFVLRLDEKSPIDYRVLKDYYDQINEDIEDIAVQREIVVPGRLINIGE